METITTVPDFLVPRQTAVPTDILFLREPEVVTLLKQLLKTQEASLSLLQDVTAHRRSFATDRARGA